MIRVEHLGARDLLEAVLDPGNGRAGRVLHSRWLSPGACVRRNWLPPRPGRAPLNGYDDIEFAHRERSVNDP